MDKELQSEWIINEDFVHINHAAIGPWPRRTCLAINKFATENGQVGSFHYLAWMETEALLRKQFQALINAESSDEIAILKNTSEALSVIAYGLNWQVGDNVVISNEEFPSNHIVWESLKNQGVEIRYADLQSGNSAEDEIKNQCDPNTKLLSISSVQYASGTRLNLKTLGEFCNQQNILFCIDAIQSIGAVEFDVQTYHADFVVADGHKWMLGPEGVALFYCKSNQQTKLKLHQYGWHMVEDFLNFSEKNWKIANSARRFECGSPNMLGIHGLSASLSLLLEVGMSNVEKMLMEKTNYLYENLAQLSHIKFNCPADPNKRAGIINIASNEYSNEAKFTQLKKANVFCALRGKGIRLSPHYYTSKSKLDRVIQLLAD